MDMVSVCVCVFLFVCLCVSMMAATVVDVSSAALFHLNLSHPPSTFVFVHVLLCPVFSYCSVLYLCSRAVSTPDRQPSSAQTLLWEIYCSLGHIFPAVFSHNKCLS